MVYAIWQIGPTNTNRETLLQREYRLQYRNSTSTTHEIENTSLTLYFEFVVIADVTCLIDRVSVRLRGRLGLVPRPRREPECRESETERERRQTALWTVDATRTSQITVTDALSR